MSQAMPPKPRPEITEDSRPYWDGLRQHRLLLQCCTDCGRLRHYPRPLCDACHSFACDWVAASGAAHVHSWTVAHHAFHPAFRNELPTVLVTADLAEGVRLLAPLQVEAPVTLQLGQRLQVGYWEVDPGLTVPVLRLDESG